MNTQSTLAPEVLAFYRLTCSTRPTSPTRLTQLALKRPPVQPSQAQSNQIQPPTITSLSTHKDFQVACSSKNHQKPLKFNFI